MPLNVSLKTGDHLLTLPSSLDICHILTNESSDTDRKWPVSGAMSVAVIQRACAATSHISLKVWVPNTRMCPDPYAPTIKSFHIFMLVHGCLERMDRQAWIQLAIRTSECPTWSTHDNRLIKVFQIMHFMKIIIKK
jgi:hypothetical protein